MYGNSLLKRMVFDEGTMHFGGNILEGKFQVIIIEKIHGKRCIRSYLKEGKLTLPDGSIWEGKFEEYKWNFQKEALEFQLFGKMTSNKGRTRVEEGSWLFEHFEGGHYGVVKRLS